MTSVRGSELASSIEHAINERATSVEVGALAAKLLKEAGRLSGMPAEASARHHAAMR